MKRTPARVISGDEGRVAAAHEELTVVRTIEATSATEDSRIPTGD
jgi:hypothetical protein